MLKTFRNRILRTQCEQAGLEFAHVRKAVRKYRKAYFEGKSRITGLTNGQRKGWEAPAERLNGMIAL